MLHESDEYYMVFFTAENRIPESIVASFTHDIFIKGCQTNFEIDGPNELEVADLYPEERFITLDQCFNEFYARLLEAKVGAEGGEKVTKVETKVAEVLITAPEVAEIMTPSHVMEPLPISALCA